MSSLARVATGVAFLMSAPVGIVLVGSDTAAYAAQVSAYQACAPAHGPLEGVDPEQAQNARTIVRVGQDLRIPDFGLAVALATAQQESGLRALNFGHLDSLGLFQQRAPWGTADQRLDPATTARMFYTGGSSDPDDYEEPGLLDVDGWQLMTLSQAAQAVQHSADGDAYGQWEDDAYTWLAEILGPAPRTPPGESPPTTDDPGDAIFGCGPDGQAIVGDIEALRARAAAFVDAIASGQPDPFYGEISYYRQCGSLAARIHGHEASGYYTAIEQWRAYVADGLAHPGDTDPPPGALVFWDTDTAGHVAVYLGEHQVVTNDLYDRWTGLHGGVYFAPIDDITDGAWHLPYLGWAPPAYSTPI